MVVMVLAGFFATRDPGRELTGVAPEVKSPLLLEAGLESRGADHVLINERRRGEAAAEQRPATKSTVLTRPRLQRQRLRRLKRS